MALSMNSQTRSLGRAFLLGTTVLAMAGAPQAMARVGVTSATDGDPLGKPPAENERVLRIGIDIQANEVVTTNAQDRAHLMFLDGTSLTIGPNAQLVIDRFVFDPNTKTGDLAISASKGVFRLVGGKISKTKPITITTPSSTIGIRGGITILTVQPTRTTSTFVFGNNMTVTAAGTTQNVTRPGSQVTTVQGSMPGAPAIVPVGALNAPLNQLDGGVGGGSGKSAGGTAPGNTGTQSGAAPGGSAGADQKAQSSGFSGANSGNAASQPPTTVTAMVSSTPAAQKISNSEFVANALTNVQTETQTQQALQEIKTASTSSTPDPTVIVTRGRFLRDPSISSFDNVSLAAPRNVANNQPLKAQGNQANGLATITTSDGRSFSLPWLPGQRFAIDVDSPFGRATGSGYVSADSTFFGYVLTGSDSKQFGVFGGTPTTTAQFPTSGFATHDVSNALNPGSIPFGPGRNATIDAAATISPLYSVYSQRLGVTTPPGVSPNQGAQSFQVSVAIAGQGMNQRSYIGAFIGDYFTDFTSNTIFNSGGYSGTYRANGTTKIDRLTSAQVTADTGQGNAIYGSNADTMVYVPDTARTTVTNGVGTTVRIPQASFEQPYTNLSGTPYTGVTLATKTATPETLGQTRTSQTTNGYVGGIIEARDASGNFSTRLLNAGGSQPTDVSITTDPTTNRARATIVVRNFDASGAVGAPIATFQLGSTSSQRLADSVFIDDRIYGMRDRQEDSSRFSKVTVSSSDVAIASRTFLTSYNAAPLKDNLLPGGVTPCECAFMSWGWWNGDVRYDNSAFRPGERDRMNLATYVTGTLTRLVDLPSTGTATYAGHAIGNVVNGSSSYVAAGTYNNSWNFGTQTGAVSIKNFDGATYNGTTALTSGTVNFTGGLSGAGRTGAVNGSFLSSPTNPVAGQAGNFSVTGTGYKAGGTFAAEKK